MQSEYYYSMWMLLRYSDARSFTTSPATDQGVFPQLKYFVTWEESTMKFTFSLITAAFISISWGSPLPSPQSDGAISVEARSAQTCGDSNTAVPLYRAYNALGGDHFYTTSAIEIQSAAAIGWTFNEGITGHLFPNQQLGTVPFYRLYNPSIIDHFYTTSAQQRDVAIANLGYVFENVVGYVYPDTACGGSPLYRLYNSVLTDHFYTMSASERDFAAANGWVGEGVAAYVLPA
ncbi:hypothetical protein Hypma_003509 [Hypsizygus marmoreus]|uniref:DUF5648 domain-containing protein n=1 Tax=Hypsizygus marmoreus TaxID=39966 RepID=A0A369J1P3_HYPMA|nr:hypothetical protein Hypma_003509 [Hypsizygus marmoreus]